MNKRRLVFLIVFGLYHLFVLGFTLYVDTQRENFRFLSGMLSNFYLLKYEAGLGVLFFLVEGIWSWVESSTQKRTIKALGNEKNELKARVYDMQEEVKEMRANSSQSSSPSNPES